MSEINSEKSQTFQSEENGDSKQDTPTTEKPQSKELAELNATYISETQSLNLQLAEKTQALTEIQTQLHQKEEQLSSLQNTLSNLTNQHTQLKSQHQNLEGRLQVYKLSLEQEQKKSASLQIAIQSKQTELDNSLSVESALKKELEHLRQNSQKISSLEQQLNTKDQLLSQHIHALQTAEKTIHSFEASIEKERSNANELQMTLGREQEKLVLELEKELRNKEDIIQNVRTVERVKVEQSLSDQIDALVMREKEDKLMEVQRELEKSLGEITKLKKFLKSLEEQRPKLLLQSTIDQPMISQWISFRNYLLCFASGGFLATILTIIIFKRGVKYS